MIKALLLHAVHTLKSVFTFVNRILILLDAIQGLNIFIKEYACL